MGAHKHHGKQTGKAVTTKVLTPGGSVHMETFVPWTMVKPKPAKIIAPADAPALTTEAKAKAPDKKESPLVRALGLAHHWQRLLDHDTVESMNEIAQREGLNPTRVRRLMQLTLLAPHVVEELINSKEVNLEKVVRQSWPYCWSDQERTLKRINVASSTNRTFADGTAHSTSALIAVPPG